MLPFSDRELDEMFEEIASSSDEKTRRALCWLVQDEIQGLNEKIQRLEDRIKELSIRNDLPEGIIHEVHALRKKAELIPMYKSHKEQWQEWCLESNEKLKALKKKYGEKLT